MYHIRLHLQRRKQCFSPFPFNSPERLDPSGESAATAIRSLLPVHRSHRICPDMRASCPCYSASHIPYLRGGGVTQPPADLLESKNPPIVAPNGGQS